LINRPEIKAAESRLASSKLDISIARSALLPSLSLGASIGTGFYDLKGRVNPSFNQQINDNLSTNVGFNLQIPIFNKFETKNRIKSAEINVKNAQLQIDDTKLQLQKTIRQAYQNAMAAQQRWKSASKSESVSKEAYRYVEQKYENERATVYELYQAKNNLFRVQSELTQSKYEYVLRMKILELLQ
jgi:outer membrane protein